MSATNVGKLGYNKVPMRRPNDASSKIGPKGQTILPQNLIEKIETLAVNDSESCKACIEIFNSLASNQNAVREVMGHLHTACLVNCSLSRPMAMFLATLIKSKAEEGSLIRTQWLLLLQKDYEVRQTLASSSRSTFLNSVLSHGEIYSSLLIGSTTLNVLAPPLIDYLQMALLSGTKEDYRVLLFQLLINGKNLSEDGGEKYEELLVEIRKKLLICNSPELLLALDICNGGFPHQKGPLRDFYESQLKDDYTALECRVLGLKYKISTEPIESLSNDIAEKAKLVKDTSWQKTSGDLPDVTLVRERMRAKGLLRRSMGIPPIKTIETDELKEKDDEFYGIQLERTKSVESRTKNVKQAMSCPLPDSDDLD